MVQKYVFYIKQSSIYSSQSTAQYSISVKSLTCLFGDQHTRSHPHLLCSAKPPQFHPPLIFKRSNSALNRPNSSSLPGGLECPSCRLLLWPSVDDAVIWNGRAGDRSVHRALLVRSLTMVPRLSRFEAGPETQISEICEPHDVMIDEFPQKVEVKSEWLDGCIGDSPSSLSTVDSTTQSVITNSPNYNKNSCQLLSPVAVKFIRPESLHLKRQKHKSAEVSAIYKEALCYRVLNHRLRRLERERKQGLRKQESLRDQLILGADECRNWRPVPDVVGYHLNKRSPGRSVIVTRLLSGPDMSTLCRWDMETGSSCVQTLLRRIWWCILILRRVYQIHRLGVRHNDIKPSNFVIDLDWNRQLRFSQGGGCEMTAYKQTQKLRELIDSDRIFNFGTNPTAHFDLQSEKNEMDSFRCDLRAPDPTPAPTPAPTPDPHYVSSVDIKLIDFGCATPLMFSGYSGGTPAYLSPELIQSAQRSKQNSSCSVDHRSDLWSVGIALTEILCARPLSVVLKQHPIKLPLYNKTTGWEVSPQMWISQFNRHIIRKSNSIESRMAREVFDCFVKEQPSERGSVEDGMMILIKFAVQLTGVHPALFERLKDMKSICCRIPSWVDEFFLLNIS